jgi:hypothetical protein
VSYYSGDPGFFSIFKTIGSSLASFIPGVGPVASKVISHIPLPVRSGVMRAGRAIIKHPVISGAGAAAVLAAGGAEAGRMSMGGHRGRKPSARHLRALAMGLRRAKPRMNVTNVHALRKALRRAHGFARLAMKTIHLVHPKHKGRFGGFRKRRKK